MSGQYDDIFKWSIEIVAFFKNHFITDKTFLLVTIWSKIIKFGLFLLYSRKIIILIITMHSLYMFRSWALDSSFWTVKRSRYINLISVKRLTCQRLIKSSRFVQDFWPYITLRFQFNKKRHSPARLCLRFSP